jgi:hypothetical protein
MIYRTITSFLLAPTLFGVGHLAEIPPTSQVESVHKKMVEVVDQGMCAEWGFVALSAGWKPDELPQLFRIMHRESRCIPDACSVTDRPDQRRCRDWGLMQINDYSWKSTVRKLGFEMSQMHDPYWNLLFARWLFEYSEERNNNGWQPWDKTSY